MMRRRSRYTAELRRGITLCASEDAVYALSHTDAADSAQDERCTSAHTALYRVLLKMSIVYLFSDCTRTILSKNVVNTFSQNFHLFRVHMYLFNSSLKKTAVIEFSIQVHLTVSYRRNFKTM